VLSQRLCGDEPCSPQPLQQRFLQQAALPGARHFTALATARAN
jgi:hypothetical protein